jgi:hypothetical protein
MTHNLAASVHQRLLNYARATGRPFNEVLQRFAAYLGKARIPMRIDVGFGDPLVPGPSLVQLPAILDFPPPEDTPTILHEVVQVIAAFLCPVTEALLEGLSFDQRWSPGGPWMSQP